jgi:hypothetical protein
VKITTVDDVLERFRTAIVAQLRGGKFEVPDSADVPGGCYEALSAYVRLRHRAIGSTPRTVLKSGELQQRNLGSDMQASLAAIEVAFQRGNDLTQRLTRQFYKAGFNDFLFNAFGVQHMHLGELGAGRDRTKQHLMCAGTSALLFLMTTPQAAYFTRSSRATRR